MSEAPESPFDPVGSELPGTGTVGQRLTPTIYESEGQANQIDALNARLKQEASNAGTYSAARGKVGKRLDYQQRIGKISVPSDSYSPTR